MTGGAKGGSGDDDAVLVPTLLVLLRPLQLTLRLELAPAFSVLSYFPRDACRCANVSESSAQ